MKNTITETKYDVYINRYEEHLKKNDEPKKSIENRKSTIKIFFDYLCTFEDKTKFENIKRGEVELFLMESEKEGKLPNTLNRYFSFLKDFFSFYKQQNENINNIFDNWTYKKEVVYKPIILTKQEIQELYNTIASENIPEDFLRTNIAFLILLYTGCTKNELCTLHVFNNSVNVTDVINYISLNDKKIYFNKKSKKGKISRREIPLSDLLLNNIKKYICYIEKTNKINFEKYNYLFPSKYSQTDGEFVMSSEDMITNDIKKVVYKSKLVNKKISFQSFRNTFISNMVNDKIPLEVIKDITGLDYTSLKRYINKTEFENRKEETLKNNHPFKDFFNNL